MDTEGYKPWKKYSKARPIKFTNNFDAKTGKLKIKDITDGIGLIRVTSPEKGNRILGTGGNKQLEYIKLLQQSKLTKINLQELKEHAKYKSEISDMTSLDVNEIMVYAKNLPKNEQVELARYLEKLRV